MLIHNDPQSPFKTSQNVLASCYLKDDKMLIIVMNSSEKSEVQIELKAERIGKSNNSMQKILDAESEQPLKSTQGIIELEIQPGDYRILSVH